MAGEFRGTVDFGVGPMTAAGANNNVFVVEFDADGNGVWNTSYGGGSSTPSR